MSNDLPKRRTIRLPTYDYSNVGGYFVTICVTGRDMLLGDIRSGEMHLNDAGLVVASCWNTIPAHFRHVGLDAFVVMPNHVHGVLILGDSAHAGAACRAPTTSTPRRLGPPDRGSLPTVIRSFKSATARQINLLRDSPGGPVWQRNYYEHVIRNEEDLFAIRKYIADNPAQWALDEENPEQIVKSRRRES